MPSNAFVAFLAWLFLALAIGAALDAWGKRHGR